MDHVFRKRSAELHIERRIVDTQGRYRAGSHLSHGVSGAFEPEGKARVLEKFALQSDRPRRAGSPAFGKSVVAESRLEMMELEIEVLEAGAEAAMQLEGGGGLRFERFEHSRLGLEAEASPAEAGDPGSRRTRPGIGHAEPRRQEAVLDDRGGGKSLGIGVRPLHSLAREQVESVPSEPQIGPIGSCSRAQQDLSIQ